MQSIIIIIIIIIITIKRKSTRHDEWWSTSNSWSKVEPKNVSVQVELQKLMKTHQVKCKGRIPTSVTCLKQTNLLFWWEGYRKWSTGYCISNNTDVTQKCDWHVFKCPILKCQNFPKSIPSKAKGFSIPLASLCRLQFPVYAPSQDAPSLKY